MVGRKESDAAPSRAQQRQARHRARRHRRLKIGTVVTLAVLVLLAGAAVGYGEYLNHQIHRLGIANLRSTASSGVERDTVNILLVGSTSRCVLAHQSAAFGICDQGVTGVNSDVVMVLHLDPDHGRAAILSIPRDLFIPNARTTGANKIDAALYQGPSQLVQAIEDDFAIPIQHYVELNFDSFQGVVDALGGIRMYFPMPLYDAYSSLNIPTAGCHTLNGFQALAVVRARHLQYKPPGVTTPYHAYWPQDLQSDLSRIRRDHEFLRVLAAAVATRGLGNPLTDQSLVAALAPQLQVDSGLSLTDMVNLVLTFHSVNAAKAPQQTLPVRLHGGLDFYYSGYDYGSIEFPTEPEDQHVVEQFLGVPADVDTMTGAPLPAPGSVTVSVVNGTGQYGQATAAASALAADGFDAAPTGSSTPHSSPAETLLSYSPSAPGARAAAEAVARHLSGPVVLDANSTARGSTVTVVTGTDLVVSPPAAPNSTTSTPGPAPSASTTTTTTPAGATLEPATPPVEALAPFDPRSCTASGGEGP
ncbi:MAG TPA: LCP family protein [Acidimicrobiales bacterium]|nr:LCP family protein [Acidimicrobiales bacterium]